MDVTTSKTRILRMRDLAEKVGLRPSTVYELVAKGRFPAPFKIVQGGRAAGWLESEIDNWLNSRASAEFHHD
jgi:prophage regulatory protein